MTARPVLLADADAFFASVALRSRPELAAAPVAVVAHVFIASANYPARARGVRSGMLAQEALRQCPEVTLIDVPRAEIEEVGDTLFDIFHDCATAVEPGSIEEAFLDVGATDWAGAIDAGHALRRRVSSELGITISVGVGSTKLMAKLASRRAKPDGLSVIESGEEAVLRANLPMTDVWGIGATTLVRLTRIGVFRLGDVDGIPKNELQHVCGTAMARRLWRIREGTDDAVVRPVELRSSLSAEGSTAGYARPDASPTELALACVERLCKRAERAGLAGTGITLTLRPETGGKAIVLRRTLVAATTGREAWLAAAVDLLADASVPRLAGLRVTLTGLLPLDRVHDTLF
ncbi:DNA polymerase IV [Cryobacterium adonitolivorans]|uniref:DNA polymerase IV n=1 Tax=Cryobacterium adonitolivorans TaxID=1259189 RepID=A0A4V3ICZ8_9MICO|nr:DNA polymerase IV [Cryobacterium adonitolivorans]TFC04026.1 DNA polymerase IV [Cryobacterium adonitolivorans]